ncbi:MAG: helix-turn-helix transcriptional regulator [Oscillospiraceae bacterium]|nr:helix-turn-helix transcriptional regulator [Oscillospiraceae bacterium]
MNGSNFAERVKRYRKEKGMTQQELADCLGVSNKTVSRWESGDGYPDVALLVPLANALGVTVDDLLNDEKPVRTLTKTDWQNLLSFLFALGGGLLFFPLSSVVPLPLCYGIYLACLAYGTYLQRYYSYRSRWFFSLSLVVNAFVNFRASTVLGAAIWMLTPYRGAWLTADWTELLETKALELPQFGKLLLLILLLTAVLTAVTGWLMHRYGGDGTWTFPRLTVGRPYGRCCIPALFPVAYAALMLPRWPVEAQKQALAAALVVMAALAVLLFRKKGWRRMLLPVAVLLALCPLMRGTVTYLSRSLNTGQWFEGHQNPNFFAIFARPTWGTALGAAVLAALWLLLCCVHVKKHKTEEHED